MPHRSKRTVENISSRGEHGKTPLRAAGRNLNGELSELSRGGVLTGARTHASLSTLGPSRPVVCKCIMGQCRGTEWCSQEGPCRASRTRGASSGEEWEAWELHAAPSFSEAATASRARIAVPAVEVQEDGKGCEAEMVGWWPTGGQGVRGGGGRGSPRRDIRLRITPSPARTCWHPGSDLVTTGHGPVTVTVRASGWAGETTTVLQ
jgi:hypothetical protein